MSSDLGLGLGRIKQLKRAAAGFRGLRVRVLRTQAVHLAIVGLGGRRGRHRLVVTRLAVGLLGLRLADDSLEHVVVFRRVRVLLADRAEALHRAGWEATARISESAMRSAALEADDRERLAS